MTNLYSYEHWPKLACCICVVQHFQRVCPSSYYFVVLEIYGTLKRMVTDGYGTLKNSSIRKK